MGRGAYLVVLLAITQIALLSFHPSVLGYPCPSNETYSLYGRGLNASCQLPLTFNVSGDPQIDGQVGYFPMLGSPRVQGHAADTMRLLLYNGADTYVDFTSGCVFDPSAQFTVQYNYSYDITPFAYQAIIVSNGNCSIAEKQAIAASAGASVLLVYDETGVNGALHPVVDQVDLQTGWGVTVLALPHYDGTVLFNFVNAQSGLQYPVPVYITIPPSGSMSTTMRTAFYNFSQSLTVDPSLEAEVTNSEIWKWSSYVDYNDWQFDVCDHNMLFVWCEFGQLRVIDFLWANTRGTFNDATFSQMIVNSAISLKESSPSTEFPWVWARGGLAYVVTNPNFLIPFGSSRENGELLQSYIGGSFPSSFCSHFYSDPSDAPYLSLYNLDLSCNSFTTIPTCLEVFPNLLFANFSHNVITAFPSSWHSEGGPPSANFKTYSIQILQALNNVIDDTFPLMVGFQAVQILDFSNNNIYGPMYTLCNLNSLVTFTAEYNRLTSFPDLAILRFCDDYALYNIPLSFVNVQNNLITYLPTNLELSNIVVLQAHNNELTGSMPSLSLWRTLQQLLIPHNKFTGTFPCFANSMLTEVDISYNSFSGICDQFSETLNPSLSTFNCDYNDITNFPDSLIESNIRSFTCSNNHINAQLAWDFNEWVTLSVLDLHNNNLHGAVPDVAFIESLTYFDLSYNNLGSLSTPYVFDNLTSLFYLDLTHNSIYSTLPTLKDTGCGATDTIMFDFSYNRFYGGLPQFNGRVEGTYSGIGQYPSGIWDYEYFQQCMTKYATFLLDHNELNDTNSIAALATNFSVIDLSYNSLSIQPSLGGSGSYEFGEPLEVTNAIELLDALVRNNPNLYTLRLDNNQLSGSLRSSYMTYWDGKPIAQLSMTNNFLTSLPTDLWQVPWNFVDFDSNSLTGDLNTMGSPQKPIASMRFTGNPSFYTPNFTLPSYLVIDPTHSRLVPDYPYSCNAIISTQFPGLSVGLDPSYYGYQGCTCDVGYYGEPSTGCQLISYSPITLSPNIPINSLISNGAVPSHSFTDEWFEDNRHIVGIDSTWVVNSTSLCCQPNPSFNVLSATFVSEGGDGCPSSYSPVLSVAVYLHLDLSLFSEPSDVLIVSAEVDGVSTTIAVLTGGSLTYTLYDQQNSFAPTVATISTSPSEWPAETTTTAYVQTYGSNYANFSQMAVCGVYVYTSNVVSVNFNSHDARGKHFFATYAVDNSVPTGFHVDAETGLLTANIPLYTLPDYAPIILYAANGVVSALIIIAIIVTFKFRQTAIMRVSMLPFLFFILLCLLGMSTTSVFFVLSPDNSSTSTILCHARVWCSTFPMMCVISILYAKSLRMNVIFDAKTKKKMALSPPRVLGLAGTLILGEVGFLVAFSVIGMSNGELMSCGDFCEVWGCNRVNYFDQWAGGNVAYIGLVMLGGAAISFKNKNIPAPFGENVHIMITFLCSLLCLATIVPLDWLLVNSSPVANVVIQAGGQMFVALVLLVCFVVPKIAILMFSDNKEAWSGTLFVAPVVKKPKVVPKTIARKGRSSSKKNVNANASPKRRSSNLTVADNANAASNAEFTQTSAAPESTVPLPSTTFAAASSAEDEVTAITEEEKKTTYSTANSEVKMRSASNAIGFNEDNKDATSPYLIDEKEDGKTNTFLYSQPQTMADDNDVKSYGKVTRKFSVEDEPDRMAVVELMPKSPYSRKNEMEIDP